MTEAASIVPRPPVDEMKFAGLMSLAQSLWLQGRLDDAVAIFAHLATLAPGHLEAHRSLVAVLGAGGRTLEALGVLLGMKAAIADPDVMLPIIREQALPAVAKYNAHLQAGEIEEAERYAALMAALVPHSQPMLLAALSCNQALGRQEASARYAKALLALDPKHVLARAALAAQGPAADDVASQHEQRTSAALSPAPGLHPLVQLRDLHDAASAILCDELTPDGEAQIERLLQAARAVVVDAPMGSEWEGWEKHYRLLMESVDLAAVGAPTPEPSPESQVNYVTSGGKRLAEKDLRATAKRLGAKAVFFAAADEAYVDLYARWYALSILRRADVPCLVVIHVIGGAGRLAEIARGVGVKDERLIYAGDDFDAGAVATRCYDSPPKGLIDKPVAHLQSVRFIRLGALMQALKLPVFVSDIDLLLQRGVRDLLKRCAGDDVVFNENSVTMNAGSRLTANLLLLNPTDNAARFLRFLRGYLEHELVRPEVTRWIDQLALVMARHHLRRRGDKPRIGYFDTQTDINNVMYPSYQQHPFRFLSLYHGFDTSSLEGDPRVLGEAGKPAKRAKTTKPAPAVRPARPAKPIKVEKPATAAVKASAPVKARNAPAAKAKTAPKAKIAVAATSGAKRPKA